MLVISILIGQKLGDRVLLQTTERRVPIGDAFGAQVSDRAVARANRLGGVGGGRPREIRLRPRSRAS